MGGEKKLDMRTLDSLKKTIKKGDTFVVLHRPIISIRIIEVVKDKAFKGINVTHVVYAFSLNEKDAKILPIEDFYEYIEKGMLQLVTEHKYHPGDSFYGTEGHLYIVQRRSNIYHPEDGHKYFVTVISIVPEDECKPHKWGNVLTKRYLLEEAILSESVLDSLEPFAADELAVDDLDLDVMSEEFELLNPTDGMDVEPGLKMNRIKGRRGYVR